MNYYYINAQGQQVGPVDKQGLRYAGITPDTMVWFEGAPEWVRASSVPDLADLLTPQSNYGQPYSQYGQQQNQYGQYGQQYGPRQPYGNNMPPKPQNYLWLGIVTTCLCCFPAGIVSIVYASKSNSSWYAGDYQGAVDNAKTALTWGIVSAAVTFFIGILYVILVAIGVSGSIY